MKKHTLTALAIGSTFAAATLAPLAHAADNPFAAKALSAGYQLAQADAKSTEGKCGEGKCGAEKKDGDKNAEAKCGEGKCGGDKSATDKTKDGKCGEAKCGASK